MAEVTSLMEDWISGVTGCSLRLAAVGVVWLVGDVRCCWDKREEANLKVKTKMLTKIFLKNIKIRSPLMGRSL